MDAASVSRASRPYRPSAVSAKPPSRASDSRRVSCPSSRPVTVAGRAKRPLRVLRQKRKHLRPRVLRRVRELLLLPVEEAVRRALVGDELMLDTRSLESLLERGVVLGRDVLVGSRLQREDRRLQLGRSLGRLGWAAVEADSAGKSVLVGGGEPRLASKIG